MKRFLLALPFVAVAASQSFAAAHLMVVNHSGLPIDELSVSAPDKKAWGANLMEGLGEGVLDDGKSHDVAAVADGTYDFRISAPDEGVLCTISNVKVAGGKVELTPDHGKACK